MTRAYVDTSGVGKLLVAEEHSDAMAAWVDDEAPTLVATYLVETELRRVAMWHELPQGDVTAVLEYLSLFALPPSLFREAGLLPGRLRSRDALHLAASIRLEVDVLVTYDLRLADAAEGVGLPVLAPGRG